MKSFSRNFKVASAILFLISGCGGNPDGQGSGPKKPKQNSNRVNWSSIPTDFNPSITEDEFRTDGIENIHLQLLSFNRDVEVVYTADLLPGEAVLRVYKVWNKTPSWGGFFSSIQGKSLTLNHRGEYDCSIKIENGEIRDLSGGCYVRFQLVLPLGAEINVYNSGTLIASHP